MYGVGCTQGINQENGVKTFFTYYDLHIKVIILRDTNNQT
jgi:hypothetical protein